MAFVRRARRPLMAAAAALFLLALFASARAERGGGGGVAGCASSGLWESEAPEACPAEFPPHEAAAAAASSFPQPPGLGVASVAASPSFRGPGNSDPRPNRELPILLWWSGGLFPHFPGSTARLECGGGGGGGSCLATKERRARLRRRTRALLFYGTDFRAYEAPLPRPPHQAWALLHEESPMNNYLLSHAAGARLFNYTATFRRESGYPLSLQWLPDLDYLRRPPALGLAQKESARRREGLAAVLYIQSHCDVPSDRDRYVRELAKHLQVDSYGACLNNRELPSARLKDTSTATTEDSEFMALISKYKFHLAMENAICRDYMTEKLWRPMHVGAVPIYRGSPSVRDWMPDNHSIILIDDFESPKELAEYINFLDRNPEKYLEYLKYKSPGGITNRFLVESMERREWGLNDMTRPNYLNGFECYVCDKVNARMKAEEEHRKSRGKVPAPEPEIAQFSHMGCPPPAPGYGNIEDIPDGDSWKEMWLQDYWQSLDQAEALTAMIHHNESHQGRFWDYMHQVFMKRTQQN